MKIGLYFLILLVMISCNQHSTDKEIKADNNKLNFKICDNSDIIGKWTMCSTSGNGLMTQFNVCPIVIFNPNGSGSLGNNLISLESFKWTLKQGNLTIKYNDKTFGTTFSDTVYRASFSKQDSSMDLVIIQIEKDYRYYLSKQLLTKN